MRAQARSWQIQLVKVGELGITMRARTSCTINLSDRNTDGEDCLGFGHELNSGLKGSLVSKSASMSNDVVRLAMIG